MQNTSFLGCQQVVYEKSVLCSNIFRKSQGKQHKRYFFIVRFLKFSSCQLMHTIKTTYSKHQILFVFYYKEYFFFFFWRTTLQGLTQSKFRIFSQNIKQSSTMFGSMNKNMESVQWWSISSITLELYRRLETRSKSQSIWEVFKPCNLFGKS